jgi:predicted acylesterase/phospholipase RssA
VAVSWRTGQKAIATEKHKDLEKWIYASASEPVFFDPVSIDGELYTDGGLRSIAPIGEAIELGADEIDVIITSDPRKPSDWDTKGKHTIQYALQSVSIMTDEILLDDIKICLIKNRLAVLGEPYKEVKLRLLVPSQPIGDSLDFSREKIREMMTFGYEDACRAG